MGHVLVTPAHKLRYILLLVIDQSDQPQLHCLTNIYFACSVTMNAHVCYSYNLGLYMFNPASTDT